MPSQNPLHDAYLRNLRVLMQAAVKETQRLDKEWNQLNDLFQDKIAEENRVRLETGRPAHSPVTIAQAQGEWLELTAAFEGGNWWRAKATYLASVIQAELAMQEAGL